MAIFKETAGMDQVERIKFFYSNGFRSVEGMVGQNSKKELMDALGSAVEKYGLYVGPQSAMNEKAFPTMTANVVPAPKGQKPAQGSAEIKSYLAAELEKVFEMLKRIHGNSFIIGPGLADKELSYDAQMKNVMQNMAFCAELCEKRGVVMVIEPLNLKSHPGQFFSRAEQAYEVCNALKSPSCKILYDFFHEQMSCGNLDSLDKCFDQIGAFHIADAPDRAEPGTGCIDYPKLLKKVWDKGYRGTLGLEHKQTDATKEGDIKLMQLYRDLDKNAI